MLSCLTLRRVTEAVAEALLPQRCIVCGRFGSALHRDCIESLSVAAPPRCGICWAPVRRDARQCARCAEHAPAYAHLRAPFRFTAETRRALLEAKFRGVTKLIEPLASAAARAVPLHWRIDAVVPIPLHRSRERRRGFNQAEIAARVVARDLDVPLARSLLRRVRETPPQASLSAGRRATNLRGAFAVTEEPPERVLLVDDVTTTGSTFDEAAGVLRRAGVATVYALAIGRED